MTSKTKTKNDLMKKKILTHVEYFVSRLGVRGWNMDDLADKSGIAKRTLYKIIISKEQLLHDFLLEEVGNVHSNLYQIFQTKQSFLERMELLITYIPEFMKKIYLNRRAEILNEYPNLELEMVTLNKNLLDGIKSFFQEGIDLGILREDTSPELILDILQALSLHFLKYNQTEREISEKTNLALKVLIRGCKTAP